jgi:hypothetical protein
MNADKETVATRRVKTIALLNNLQGVFELVVVGFLIVTAWYLPGVLQLRDFVEELDGGLESSPNPNLAHYRSIANVILAAAILIFLGACLRFFAAARNRRLKGRMLGIASLFGVFISSTTCICAPTGIALLIWGIIVLLNRDVRELFDSGLRSS